MKHPPFPTIFLIIMFLTAQVIGLAVVNEYIDVGETSRTGKTVKNDEVYTRIGVEPPDVENESFTFLELDNQKCKCCP